MAPATRRELLGTAVFAALAGIAGAACAAPEPNLDPIAPGEDRCRTVLEAEILGMYRDASPTEQAAMLRLMERTIAGDDMHTIGTELMMAFGFEEAEARARTAAALERRAS